MVLNEKAIVHLRITGLQLRVHIVWAPKCVFERITEPSVRMFHRTECLRGT